MRIKSLTYATIIVNLIIEFLMNMDYIYILYIFNKMIIPYAFRLFNPFKNICNFLNSCYEISNYVFQASNTVQGFICFNILNPSRT